MRVDCFRYANFSTPLRVLPSERAQRYNRVGDPPVQYLADHPLAVWAEFARWHDLSPDTLADVAARIWVLRVDVEGLPEVTFDNAETFGVTPERLVADDYSDCQDLAERLRTDGHGGFITPSAALPGARNVVLFGRFVLSPFSAEPALRIGVPGSMVADGAHAPVEILGLYRERGAVHRGVEEWRAGRPVRVLEPTDYAYSPRGVA